MLSAPLVKPVSTEMAYSVTCVLKGRLAMKPLPDVLFVLQGLSPFLVLLTVRPVLLALSLPLQDQTFVCFVKQVPIVAKTA
jgi:hypothetical protein